jgi:hypothetical protein
MVHFVIETLNLRALELVARLPVAKRVVEHAAIKLSDGHF